MMDRYLKLIGNWRVTHQFVVIALVVAGTPVLSYLTISAHQSWSANSEIRHLSKLMQTNLSRQRRNKAPSPTTEFSPELNHNLDVVQKSAALHQLRLESLVRENRRSSAIKIGLNGRFWETTAFLRDLEAAGFDIEELNLSTEDARTTKPIILSQFVLNPPRNAVSAPVQSTAMPLPIWRNPFSQLRPTLVYEDGDQYWSLRSIHSLSGIAQVNDVLTATIDGRDYVEGEILGGRRITKIDGKRVWLSQDDETFLLDFSSPLPR